MGDRIWNILRKFCSLRVSPFAVHHQDDLFRKMPGGGQRVVCAHNATLPHPSVRLRLVLSRCFVRSFEDLEFRFVEFCCI
ncbi:hypothetical protein E2C01_074313 [Portunus trituberculatus]|uniref:Uncharacterized protein n=1 Tax=Portunus trituberculatus TaxID=210409 RepID=A0A5B7IG01_PORTR|nr:hypothetical protein [Portunus trituberculatus]